MTHRRTVALAVVVVAALARGLLAQETTYRVTFPEPEHRWMQVEATFAPAQPPLELRMSRSSPGRYALHEFAKNVYDVHAFDAAGRELPLTRPDPFGWTVPAFEGPVRVTYRIFGNRVDGTYLAIDTTHAHMNMPAAFMWARGMADRAIRVTFVPPPSAGWKAATQLFPTDDPWTFTAPNLQYFMDSPTELGPIWDHRFSLPQPDGSRRQATFRIALHHEGSAVAAQQFAQGVERIAAEQGAIFGAFPEYETGRYTFIADYLPYADGDAMEHRNSTVLTGALTLATSGGRRSALETVSHELFHCWNVERIRPASLEPFDFERENMSGELWLAEGFTSYYGPLVMHRAGLASLEETLGTFGSTIDAVVNGPGRRLRSAVEMSRMAPFVDGSRPADDTNFAISIISYYTWGAALGLALDLSLRDLTDSRVTLDDYMRAMWRTHGQPGGPAPGLVSRPYRLQEARDRLAEVSGDPRFAAGFFSRFAEGHDAADYARLLARAGFVLRPRNAGRGWAGALALDTHAQGARVSQPVAPGSPAYAAGLEQDDVITSVGSRTIATGDDVRAATETRRPGDAVPVQFLRRGVPVRASMTLAEDPSLILVTLESTGATPSVAQRAFREAWLSSRVRMAQPPQ